MPEGTTKLMLEVGGEAAHEFMEKLVDYVTRELMPELKADGEDISLIFMSGFSGIHGGFDHIKNELIEDAKTIGVEITEDMSSFKMLDDIEVEKRIVVKRKPSSDLKKNNKDNEEGQNEKSDNFLESVDDAFGKGK